MSLKILIFIYLAWSAVEGRKINIDHRKRSLYQSETIIRIAPSRGLSFNTRIQFPQMWRFYILKELSQQKKPPKCAPTVRIPYFSCTRGEPANNADWLNNAASYVTNDYITWR